MPTVATHLWSRQLDDPVNCLVVGRPFQEYLSEENDILIGTSDGRVLVLNQAKPVEVLLETKGTSILSMVLHDLTGQNALDLAVGDANGVITMFSRQQILSKRDIGTAVAQLGIHQDEVSGYEIVAGGVSGAVYSFRPHQTLWKFEVAEASARIASLGNHQRRSASIRCLLSVPLPVDDEGTETATLLVCDGWDLLHLIQKGVRVGELKTPCPVQAIAAGQFLTRADKRRFNTDPVMLKLKGNTDTSLLPGQQALLAGQDGSLYIMLDLQIHHWFQVGFTVHSIVSFRLKDMEPSEPDLFVCTGQASCVHVYQNDKLLLQIDTSDWVKSVTLGDVNGDGEDELVLGLVNKTVEVYKLHHAR